MVKLGMLFSFLEYLINPFRSPRASSSPHQQTTTTFNSVKQLIHLIEIIVKRIVFVYLKHRNIKIYKIKYVIRTRHSE